MALLILFQVLRARYFSRNYKCYKNIQLKSAQQLLRPLKREPDTNCTLKTIS